MEKPRRAAPTSNSASSTTAQLRDDIDSGRTGDKVDWSDPAASPLGTDEEAAGSAPSAGQIRETRARELARPAASAPQRWKPGGSWALVVFIVLVVGALIGWIVASA